MAAGFTTAYANKALDHFLKGTAYSQPANLYLGLATADPGATATLGSVAEPSGNAYARQSLNSAFAAASGGSKASNADIVFPAATPGSWGTISHYFITDGTDVIWTGALASSRVVNVGSVFKILSGGLVLTLARSGQGGLTTAYSNKMLDHMFKGTAYSQPANLTLGLTTADPTATATLGGISEVSGGSYARQNVNTAFAAAVSGQKATNAAVTFPVATAGWGTVTHWFITDGTDVIWMGQVGTASAVNNGDQAQFASGALIHALART